MSVTIIKPLQTITAKHKCRFKPSEYLDILSRNQFNINYDLLMSKNSIFKLLHKKVGLKNTILSYKKGGIRINTNIKYNTVGFSTLKAINGSLGGVINDKGVMRQRRLYSNKSFNKKNLKYSSIKSGPPCNGQRTKTNAKTCKRKKHIGAIKRKF